MGCSPPFLITLVTILYTTITITQAHVQTIPFELGDEIKLECRRNLTAFPQAFTGRLPPKTPNPAIPAPPVGLSGPGSVGAGPILDETDIWGPGIVCSETGREMAFKFGSEEFLFCGWTLANEDTYNFARAVMSQEIGWNCRIPMSKDKSFYLPVVIPLWGVVEPTHLHLNYHMNFVFHVDDGRIIGASVYPVRDRFQLGRPGSMINLHGPVKWFSKHGFTAISGTGSNDSGGGGSVGTGPFGVALWCLFSIIMTSTALSLFYVFRLKPMLAKRYLKGD